MKIQEISIKSGLSRDTIRYWEKLGLLKPGRELNGYREYGEADYRRLVLIRLGKEAGFTLQEISALLDPAMGEDFTFTELSSIMEAQLVRIDERIAELGRIRGRIAHILENCPRAVSLKTALFDQEK
jgi:MerR family transcriptional regulator, copper efflux regulator